MDTFENGSKAVTHGNVEHDIWETTFRVRGIRGVIVTPWGDGWAVFSGGSLLKDFSTFEAATEWLKSYGFTVSGASFARM